MYCPSFSCCSSWWWVLTSESRLKPKKTPAYHQRTAHVLSNRSNETRPAACDPARTNAPDRQVTKTCNWWWWQGQNLQNYLWRTRLHAQDVVRGCSFWWSDLMGARARYSYTNNDWVTLMLSGLRGPAISGRHLCIQVQQQCAGVASCWPSNFLLRNSKISVTISVDYICRWCCSHGEKIGELARYHLLNSLDWMDGQF